MLYCMFPIRAPYYLEMESKIKEFDFIPKSCDVKILSIGTKITEIRICTNMTIKVLGIEICTTQDSTQVPLTHRETS